MSKARGELLCDSNAGLAEFLAPDANGVYRRFDTAMRRARLPLRFSEIPMKARVVPTSEARFRGLSSGEVDILVETATRTLGCLAMKAGQPEE